MKEKSDYFVEMKNIYKYFGKVAALNGVNFRVNYNEIVGLIGDNGAGKSTLIKILSGFFPPTSGEIYINGNKIPNNGYSVARSHDLEIETVYQEKALGEKQTLWRNIFLGRQIVNPLGFIDAKKEKVETERIMKELIGFRSKGITADSHVSKLSGGERQGISIGRAMYFNARLIILDEPTAALSLKEASKVQEFILKIKQSGRSCVYITHAIHNTYDVSDRFVFIDRGKIIGEYEKSKISLEELSEKLMTLSA